MRVRRSRSTVAVLVLSSLLLQAVSTLPATATSIGIQSLPRLLEKEHGEHDQGNGGGNSHREDESRDRTQPEPFVERGGVVSGTVSSIDYGRNVVVVKAGGVRRSIMLTPTTTFEMRGSRGLSIADLRPGQRVDVYMTIVGGVPIAQIVRLR